MNAVYYGHTGIVKLLLENGMDVNARTSDGRLLKSNTVSSMETSANSGKLPIIGRPLCIMGGKQTPVVCKTPGVLACILHNLSFHPDFFIDNFSFLRDL